jgi:hypothetical protein
LKIATIECYVCLRLKEPSTWVTFGATLGLWADKMPEPYSYYIYSVAALCGVLGILLQEGKHDANSGMVGEQAVNAAMGSAGNLMGGNSMDNAPSRPTISKSKPIRKRQETAKGRSAKPRAKA